METNTPRNLFTASLAVGGLILLSACDVEQTSQGEMPDIDVDAEAGEMPEYKIVKTEEGESPEFDVDVEAGEWPTYDIDWASLEAGLAETTVKVPEVKVTYEEKQIEVPFVGIDWPNDEETERRVINVAFRTPDAGYTTSIQEIYRKNNTLMVLAKVSERQGGASAQAITMKEDMVMLEAPENVDIQVYAYGDLDGVQMPGNYQKVSGPADVNTSGGTRLHPKS